jgi:hypothetical protein
VIARYERVHLVDPTDHQYRRFRGDCASMNTTSGAGLDARALFARDAEKTLRRFLSTTLALAPRRVIHFHERRGSRLVEKYREIDAVARSDRRLLLFEVKTTRSAAGVNQGIRQLETAREILTTIVPEITTCLLVVDTDDAANSEVATHLSLSPKLLLIGSIEELSTDPRTHVMPFSVADIEELAHAPVHLEWRDAA